MMRDRGMLVERSLSSSAQVDLVSRGSLLFEATASWQKFGADMTASYHPFPAGKCKGCAPIFYFLAAAGRNPSQLSISQAIESQLLALDNSLRTLAVLDRRR
jgi:hypothetical protein